MKSKKIETLTDQRRIYSHIAILFFALSVVLFAKIVGNYPLSGKEHLRLVALIFIYLESFIYLARIIFVPSGPEPSSKGFLRYILIRFTIYYLACFVLALIIFTLFRFFGFLINGLEPGRAFYNFFHFELRVWFKPTLLGLSFGALLFLIIQWLDALNRERKLKEQSLIFQNETLHSQINPHFLFNSLNTLSSLVSTQPEEAEGFIIRLSSIYRYILENSKKRKVSLRLELGFVNDYFELHRIRDNEKILLNINVPDPGCFEILPVSLQTLIENAIKHNMATRIKPLMISIFIEDQHIIVMNNLQKMNVEYNSTKIGLKNLSERVRLITGKSLIIEETNTNFIVKVPLLK